MTTANDAILENTQPSSGRYVNEAGETVNIADLFATLAPATGTLAATTVAVAGLTTIGSAIDVSAETRIFVQIDNTNAAAIVFDAFEIQASMDGGVTFETLYSSAADYTSPTGILIGTSGDLTTLAAAATGWFLLDVGGIDQVRVQASANTTQSVGVTGKWSAS